MPSILLEDSKYQKKYKCPYCDKRYARPDLINHIDKKHPEMIPKDYTSTRVVFNMINKKDHGSCIICKKETAWNEDHARYERLCGSKSCHDKYVKIAHTNTKIDEKLRDPEFQQKMLAGRSISGTYKFADGNQVSYTGSYERQLLEFLDKFLGFKSYDVESPGPTIEYTYKGKKHFWITDQYLIPYNLVFDCKDGGDNPNNREMKEYREKQIAKEKAIKKQGKYNYIRLTNNCFDQLLDIMFELKMNFDESQKTPVIRINEHSNMAISALPPANNNVYIINYMKKNTFVKDGEEKRYALCKDYMQDAVTVKNGIFDTLSIDELKEMDLKLYKYNRDAEFNSILEKAENDTDFYKILTGKELLDSDQIKYDALFEEVFPFTSMLNMMTESLISTMKQSLPMNKMVYEGVDLPYFELESMNKNDSIVKFYRDIDGIFLMNEETGFRTKSYNNSNILEEFRNDIANILVEAKRIKGQEYDRYAPDDDDDDTSGEGGSTTRVATTSIGKGGILDSVAQNNIEELDAKKEKIILESETMVSDYINYVSGKVVQYAKGEEKSQLPKRMIEDLMFLSDNGFDDIDIEKTILGNYFGLSEIIKTIEKLKDEGKEDQEVLYNINTNKKCQKIIKSILTMRMNYVNRIVGLMSNMIKNNYKILGLTEKEAQIYLNALQSDKDDENIQTVGKIKDLIIKNKDKFITNDGKSVDLRTLGYGVILGSDESLYSYNPNDTSGNIDGMMKCIQSAMRYDVVVIAHGSSGDHITTDIVKDKDKTTSFIKDAVLDDNDGLFNKYKKIFQNKNVNNDRKLRILFLIGKNVGHPSIKLTQEILNSFHASEKSYVKMSDLGSNGKQIFEVLKKGDGKKIREKLDQIMENLFDRLVPSLINSEDGKDSIEDGVEDLNISKEEIISQDVFIYGIKEGLSNRLYPKILPKIIEICNMKSEVDLGKETWTCQPTRTLKAGPFRVVDDLVRQLIKEGYKKIILYDCNPGHHKLADDIMQTKGVLINYSDFSNYMESTAKYNIDASVLHEIAELEDGLKQLALEADIDYDDNEYLLECMDWAQNNLDAINEGKIVDTLLNIFKKVIGAIIGFFKKIIHLFGLLISKVKELFSGTKETPKNVKKEFPELSAKIASPKDKKMVEIKGKTREELQTQAEKINSGIGSSIKAIQAQQNKDVSRIKQDIITLEKAEQEIKAGKK